MIEIESIDRDDVMRLAAPVVALIGTGLLWRSGSSGVWSPMVAEWLGFVGAGGILVFPFAAYLFADGWLALRRAADAVNWPCAKGTIEGSEVRPSGRGYYAPQVSYSYAVEGTVFTGDAIQSTRIVGSETDAGAIAARYPVGAEIDVRYNPRRPESSMLELGPGAARWRMIVAAVMSAGTIIFATLGVWHNSYY